MDCRIKSGNDDVNNHSRDAPLRPRFAHHHQATTSPSFLKEFAPCKEGRRSAERRIQPMTALIGRGSGPEPARLPALHRGTRQRGRNRLWLSSRTAFPGTARAGVLPTSATSPIQPAPGRPVLVPAEQGPGAARERMAHPRAGTALAPPKRYAVRNGALRERGAAYVTEMGTFVNEIVTCIAWRMQAILAQAQPICF
jgi:hypothetical protein